MKRLERCTKRFEHSGACKGRGHICVNCILSRDQRDFRATETIANIENLILSRDQRDFARFRAQCPKPDPPVFLEREHDFACPRASVGPLGAPGRNLKLNTLILRQEYTNDSFRVRVRVRVRVIYPSGKKGTCEAHIRCTL